MRIYLGHKLPLGFYGGVGFGRYGRPRVTHDGRNVELYDVSFWLGVIAFFVLAWFFASAAHGQQISPIAQEAKGPRARGEITVTNQGVVPLAVVMEPKSLGFTNGQPTWTPLHGVTLKLSEQSARLGPKQSRTISYDAKCDQLPCAFSLFAKFVVGHTDQGIAVALHIPSTVYLCEKKKDCRANVLHAAGAQ